MPSASVVFLGAAASAAAAVFAAATAAFSARAVATTILAGLARTAAVALAVSGGAAQDEHQFVFHHFHAIQWQDSVSSQLLFHMPDILGVISHSAPQDKNPVYWT